MAFREPVKRTKARKTRTKHLTLYNTDKYYNLKLTDRKVPDSRYPVNLATKAEIDKYMLEMSPAEMLMDSRTFLYVQGSLLSDEYALTMIRKGMDVFYMANMINRHSGLVPDKILDALANSRRGGVIYRPEPEPCRDYVNNVSKAHMATKVIISQAVKIPDIEPNVFENVLAPLRMNVDEVQIDFTPLHADEVAPWEKSYYYYSLEDDLYHVYPKSGFEWFEHIRKGLSGWGMLINILYSSESERDTWIELSKQKPKK